MPLTAIGAPCSGALGANHKNPDGSVGGFVASTAKVASTVSVDPSSSVCEKAVIQGNAKLKGKSEVKGSAQIEGNVNLSSSKVHGMAKVYGSSIVTNSRICQASEVSFNVINSDYYCQTDNEEPTDPGELGKKTILGIDSNVNGIRDDVEIWINNNTSNTPEKDMYNVRMALKQIAKDVQSNMKNKDNREKSIQHGRAAIDSFSCLQDVTSPEESERFTADLQIQLYGSTMDRLKAWAKLQGNLSGQTFSVSDKKQKGSTCGFNLK